MRRAFITLCSVAACLLAAQASAAATGFIRVSNARFVDEDCKEFIANGLNTWQLLEVAAGNLASKPVVGASGVTDVIQWTLATAAANNLTVLRSFAFGTDTSFPLQNKPGVYNEHAFAALDHILNEASKYGIRLILPLTDNWSASDSKDQYVSWSSSARGSLLSRLSHGVLGDPGTPDAFYTDSMCRKNFKEHMSTIVNRRNSINGRLYRDDPTIFAWDLMNEPRCDCFPDQIPAPPEMVSCRPECAGKIQGWIEEMSGHLKSLDPNHLVTVGEEGFYAMGSVNEHLNPGNGWASITGQNFSMNHSPATIDFAAIHLWPDNWETWDLNFLHKWIQVHAEDAAAMGKPLIVEEFGKQVLLDTPKQRATIMSLRMPFYRKVYDALKESLASPNGTLRGVVFWQWGFEPYVSNSHFGKCRHCEAIQVSASDSVFTQVIRPAADYSHGLLAVAPPVPGCKLVDAKDRAKPLPTLSMASVLEASTTQEAAKKGLTEGSQTSPGASADVSNQLGIQRATRKDGANKRTRHSHQKALHQRSNSRHS
ncbi:hypothetical protein WJX73_004261 [Symbiochloris irregularis]|uniref:mannan endo-1,4-beta-mannosidase n=1 Tax=Symbiochloris irregularis TaxID=706552 RepID=A0AAW1Q469_9CHLO